MSAATLVHHRTPHRGDRTLFLNYENLASSCKPCHDAIEQSIERRGYDKAVGIDGWPVDGRHPFHKGT